MPTIDDDEFRFLPGDALRVGRQGPVPEVRRVALDPAARISALAFDPDLPADVIALHGAGLNAHSFDPTLLALARPALSVDLPGHGRSAWRDDADYRAETIASDLTDALAPLAERSRHLVGHSLGGLTATVVAARLPGLVNRLTIIDITPGVLSRRGDGDETQSRARASAVSEFITGQRDYGSVDEIIDRAIAFGIGSDRTSLQRGIALNTRRRADGRLEWTHHLAHLGDGLGSAPGTQGADPGAQAERVWAALAAIPSPITLVRASAGLVDDELEAEFRDRLPGARVLTIAGPHNLHESAPAELARVLA